MATTGGDAHHHGWTAVFPPDAVPVLERFGPFPCAPTEPPGSWRHGAGAGAGAGPPLEPSDGIVFEPPALRGERGRLAWDLRWDEEAVSAALFTFPQWAWRREVLPAAQVVPVASAPFTGWLAVGAQRHSLGPATRGTLGHIYGHGNAERWGWVHAELGGGDVLEIVTAVSRRPAMRHLPPLAFVQLRVGGRDWPRDALVAAPLFRADLGLPTWTVAGTVGRWRLRVETTIHAERAVRVGYRDPDGAGATCTNSEAADAEIVLEHRRSRWELAARWRIDGSAHAEVGTRP